MKRTWTLGIVVAALSLTATAGDYSSSSTPASSELTPEQVGKIEYERNREIERIDAAHGNKKSSDMSPSERAQIIQEHQDAAQRVLDAHGVSDKDYARYEAHMSTDDRATAKATAKATEREAIRRELKESDSPAATGPEVVPYDEATGGKAPPRGTSSRGGTKRSGKSR